MKEVLIKLVLTITFPVWALPYLCWQIVEETYDKSTKDS